MYFNIYESASYLTTPFFQWLQNIQAGIRFRIRSEQLLIGLPYPVPLFRTTAPRIRIQKKYFRIHNSAIWQMFDLFYTDHICAPLRISFSKLIFAQCCSGRIHVSLLIKTGRISLYSVQYFRLELRGAPRLKGLLAAVFRADAEHGGPGGGLAPAGA